MFTPEETKRVSSVLNKSALSPDELAGLAQAGIDLKRHESIAVDLLKELQKNPQLDPNELNESLIKEAEQEDDLSQYDPSIASAIRQSLLNPGDRMSMAEVDKELNKLDEDDADPEPAPEAQKSAQTEGGDDAMLRLLREESKKLAEAYRNKITDDLRDAVLREVIEGIPVQKTFYFMNNKVAITLRTASFEHSEQMLDLQAEFMNKEVRFTQQVTLYTQQLRIAAQLASLVVNGKMIYTQPRNKSLSDLHELIFKKNVNSEVMRNLLRRCSQEFTGLMQALLLEIGEEVFTEPDYVDIG